MRPFAYLVARSVLAVDPLSSVDRETVGPVAHCCFSPCVLHVITPRADRNVPSPSKGRSGRFVTDLRSQQARRLSTDCWIEPALGAWRWFPTSGSWTEPFQKPV